VLGGRRAECARLDRLLEAVRSGQSAVLVLRGEAGIGKSVLVGYAAERGEDCRVLRAAGVESERELPFAALHQLCSPLLDGLEQLPLPQRDALATAFGLSSGTPPDRFIVGLAVLGLLSEAAQEPLLCLVDDAHWLDRVSAQVLAFVARRLQAEPVALLFATRTTSDEDPLRGLPELLLEGLSNADARELLVSATPGRLDDRVAERIVAETHGNPLALLELPRTSTPAELAGGFGLPATLPLPGRIEESFRQRIEQLSPETHRLLLLAAADPVGDPVLLRRAAAQLGIGVEAAEPAEAAGLLQLGGRIRFHHPLVRSAVYRAAPPEERRQVHHALADATDPEVDPDRRAWHRAQAAAEPDEDVASELERSADRAQARGGLAAAAAFLERAAMLTPEPARRVRRALAAAQAEQTAGAPGSSLELLAVAEAGPLDELQRALTERLRAQLAFVQRRGSDAPPLLLRAAKRLEPLDPALALETHLESLVAALSIGGRDAVVQAAQALAATPRSTPPDAAELLMTGQALLITDGYAAGMPAVTHALAVFRRGRYSEEEELQGLPLACLGAITLWDDEAWMSLSARHVQLARDAGALIALPVALEMNAVIHVYSGQFAAAGAMIEEAVALAKATGSAPVSDSALLLAAWVGPPTEALQGIEGALEDAGNRGEVSALTYGEYATAVLHNGLGQYEAALAAAQRSNAHHPREGGGAAQLELIEAATRTGASELAAAALEHLSARTRPAGTDWALGIEARAGALLAHGDRAEALYGEAIDRLARTRSRTDLARAHLLYGEWLRRERRRLDAREQLRTAHDLLAEMEAAAFTQRAARELLATGEKARKRTPNTRSRLTAQESQIACLARDGLSNPEIGSQLFISPRTVEYHLHKVFAKLAINSRNQLGLVLKDGGPRTVMGPLPATQATV
jgi:DNA-binding CsgD family transcriptional regulator